VGVVKQRRIGVEVQQACPVGLHVAGIVGHLVLFQ
jgi:hypothetical protein